jgi:dynein heavy chain
LLSKFASLTISDEVEGNHATDTPSIAEAEEILESLFIFALTWTVGASTTTDGRVLWATFLEKVFSGVLVDSERKERASVRVPRVALPAIFSPFECVFDEKLRQWLPWMETAPSMNISKETPNTAESRLKTLSNSSLSTPDGLQPFGSIVVPTADFLRNSTVTSILLRGGLHVLFSGATATGKSMTATAVLSEVCHDSRLGEKFDSLSMYFSPSTKAGIIQDVMDSRMERRRLGVYGPPLGSRLIVFVEDLNVPAHHYGAQPPVEVGLIDLDDMSSHPCIVASPMDGSWGLV